MAIFDLNLFALKRLEKKIHEAEKEDKACQMRVSFGLLKI